MDEESSSKELKQTRKTRSRKDRSKFKKTNLHKWERKQHGEAEKKMAKKEWLLGRVLAISAEEITVEHEQTLYPCVLRGLLKKEMSRDKNLVAVGDFVRFEPHTCSIAAVQKRSSILSRSDHLRGKKQQIIAANIDQVLITASVVSPPLKPALIDRYIIASWKGNMEPVILINKVDLLKKGSIEESDYQTFIRVYRALGFVVIPLSATTEEGIAALKEQMYRKASVFAGQSGVGKSSLINVITKLSLAVGDLTKKTGKGTHTTTSAHLIHLPFEGWCIDTPGIRSFGLWDLKRQDVDAYFTDIATFGQHCKYPNCTHTHEPKCAVIEALKRGSLEPMRFESYLKLLEECS